jgi:heterodisulfide reductase subunit A
MEASEGSRIWSERLQLPVYSNGFIKPNDPHIATNTTQSKGIFIAGSCSSPMNLTDTLTDARSAAVAIKMFLENQN